MERTGLMILLLLVLPTPSLGFIRKYNYVPLLKTWNEAQSYCRENLADLATAETEDDWVKMKEIITSYGPLLWIGLHYDSKDWRWSIDNTKLYRDDGSTGFGAWFSFNYDDKPGTQHCVGIVGGLLHDQLCGLLQKSVCYDEPTHKYIPVAVPMTWSSAQSYCREKYTDLTSMKSQQEKNEIMNVTDHLSWWIGLSRANWQWSDGSDSSLRVWKPGEPNQPATEHCVCSRLEGWVDAACTRKFAFICSVPIKVRLFQVELKPGGSVDLNDPLMQEAALNHMEKHMRERGISQEFRLRWKKQPHGEIFYLRKAESLA